MRLLGKEPDFTCEDYIIKKGTYIIVIERKEEYDKEEVYYEGTKYSPLGREDIAYKVGELPRNGTIIYNSNKVEALARVNAATDNTLVQVIFGEVTKSIQGNSIALLNSMLFSKLRVLEKRSNVFLELVNGCEVYTHDIYVSPEDVYEVKQVLRIFNAPIYYILPIKA